MIGTLIVFYVLWYAGPALTSGAKLRWRAPGLFAAVTRVVSQVFVTV